MLQLEYSLQRCSNWQMGFEQDAASIFLCLVTGIDARIIQSWINPQHLFSDTSRFSQGKGSGGHRAVMQSNPGQHRRRSRALGLLRLTSAMSLLGLEGLSPLKSSLLPLSPLSASPSLICSDSDTDLEDRTPSCKRGTAECSREHPQTSTLSKLLIKPS